MRPHHSITQRLPDRRSSKERIGGLVLFISIFSASWSIGNPMPEALNRVIENNCVDCHDDIDPKGGLDFYSLEWDLEDPHVIEQWVKVHDLMEPFPAINFHCPSRMANMPLME